MKPQNSSTSIKEFNILIGTMVFADLMLNEDFLMITRSSKHTLKFTNRLKAFTVAWNDVSWFFLFYKLNCFFDFFLCGSRQVEAAKDCVNFFNPGEFFGTIDGIHDTGMSTA